MQRAELFLRRFIQASRAAEPMRTLGDDPDGFEQAADCIPHRIADALEGDAARAPAAPTLINRRVFASAACDAEGRILAADEHFTRWQSGPRISAADLGQLKAQMEVSLFIDDHGTAMAIAPFARAREWPLDASVRACLESRSAQFAAIVRLPVEFHAGLETCRRVFDWTGLETRVAAGLIEGGNARAAAKLAQVGYETARDALKSAMRKAGARRQGSFVSLCIRTESGEAPETPLGPIIQDLFGLTLRQSEITLLLADGLTRDEVARVMNLSSNIVKAELKTVFAACLVDSVAMLGRIVGQIGALAAMAHAVAVDIRPYAAASEPLRLLPRHSRPGRIALADHGPSGAAPVLFLHSGTTGRHLPPDYIRTLQRLGLRPITLDRPGFGLTTMTEGEYLDESADDLARILDNLELARASVVSRGGAISVVRFAQRHSARLCRAVLINPGVPARHDTRFVGVLGGAKRLIVNHPRAFAALARMLCRRASSRNIIHLAQSALGKSPADAALLRDPRFVAGFVRSSQQAALQDGVGLVALARCVAVTDPKEGAAVESRRFHLLFGAQDPMHARDEALSWWRSRLPEASVHVVADAGRFLHAQRPDLIASAVLSGPGS